MTPLKLQKVFEVIKGYCDITLSIRKNHILGNVNPKAISNGAVKYKQNNIVQM
jgi:hypothetical protein